MGSSNQEIHDKSVDLYIKNEVDRLTREFSMSPQITVLNRTYKNYFPVIRPFGIYYIYDDSSARYSGVDIYKEIRKKYKKFVHEYYSK